MTEVIIIASLVLFAIAMVIFITQYHRQLKQHEKEGKECQNLAIQISSSVEKDAKRAALRSWENKTKQ